MQSEWSKKKAGDMLKNVLEEHNLTVPELVMVLNNAGINETKKSVYCKLGRGSFSLAWFIQVLMALNLEMNVKSLNLKDSVTTKKR